jgi:tRNA A-37 threonylcarbamoyl transferase component Bud32
VETAQLEQALRDFDRVATLLREEKTRQVWRFRYAEKDYDFYFYPRRGGLLRKARPGSAISEFIRLQALQRSGTAAPRAVANLSGMRVRGALGDALIIEPIPDTIPLDQYLRQQFLRHSAIPGLPKIAVQIGEIINGIARAKLRHNSPSLSSFLITDDGAKVFFNDAETLRGGEFLADHLLPLAHEASRYASRADLLRAWNVIHPDYYPPAKNRRSPSLWKKLVRSSRNENQDFGVLQIDGWSGHFAKSSAHAVPWSSASQLDVSHKDWQIAWPLLRAQIESDQLEIIKRDASGDVLAGEVVLAGHPISIIVKRPKRKYRYRYAIDLFRPARAMRMWIKAWMLIARNLPCEWPMLIMEKKSIGYATDAVIVFERVPGERLDHVDLAALNPHDRDMLFRRAGRVLRKLEDSGLVHYDSKSTNWIVYRDAGHGAVPVMIDVDGVRKLNYWLQLWGIHRLLRAMKQHPQYTPADSLALCQGFAPFAGRFEQENPPQEPGADPQHDAH